VTNKNVLIVKECIVTVHVKVQTDKQLDLGRICALLRSCKFVVHMVFSGVQRHRIQLDRLCSVLCVGVDEFCICFPKCKCLILVYVYVNNFKHSVTLKNRTLHFVSTFHLGVSMILTISCHVFVLEKKVCIII
jgi:hypothetical protein